MKNYITFIALLATIALQSCHCDEENRYDKKVSPKGDVIIQRIYDKSIPGSLYRVKFLEGRDTVKVLLYKDGAGAAMIKY